MKLKQWHNKFSMIVNANLIVLYVTQMYLCVKWECKYKYYLECKKDYSQNSVTCICGNSK